MDIDREVDQGDTASKRVKFCLDQLEKAKRFKKGIKYETDVVDGLSIEEIMGALVSAEQTLKWALEEDHDACDTICVTIKCLPRDDFADGMMFWCPYCKKWHIHSRGDGHRTAHCINENSPYIKEGYSIEMMTEKELKKVQKGIEQHLAP